MSEILFTAYDALYAPLTLRKFRKIVKIVTNDIGATPMQIAEFIDGGLDGWPNQEEHYKWLEKSSAKLIALWVCSGLT